MFEVALACGRSSHHKEGDIWLSHLLTIEMKWVLKVWMAYSARLCQ